MGTTEQEGSSVKAWDAAEWSARVGQLAKEPSGTHGAPSEPKESTRAPMGTTGLFGVHDDLCSRAKALMVAKNHDYAGKSGKYPFANFETSEQLRVCTTEQGIMVRLLDKVKRLCTFLDAGSFKVADEKFEDTVLDLINYAVILSAYLRDKQYKEQK